MRTVGHLTDWRRLTSMESAESLTSPFAGTVSESLLETAGACGMTSITKNQRCQRKTTGATIEMKQKILSPSVLRAQFLYFTNRRSASCDNDTNNGSQHLSGCTLHERGMPASRLHAGLLIGQHAHAHMLADGMTSRLTSRPFAGASGLMTM